jgi:hypothetical protein
MNAPPSSAGLTRPGLIPLWCAVLAIGFAITAAGGHYADRGNKTLSAATAAQPASPSQSGDQKAMPRDNEPMQRANSQRQLGFVLVPLGILLCIVSAVALTLAFFKIVLANMRSRGAL